MAKVESFRFWCQKVLPLVYDESLSYYELLCKVVEYLNNTIAAVNENTADVAQMRVELNQFETFINNYFDNLNVQTEINNKLDAMAASGELTNLMKPYIDEMTEGFNERITQAQEDADLANSRISEIANLPEGSTSGDAELADIRVGADGVTYVSAGDAVRGQYNNLKWLLNSDLFPLDNNKMYHPNTVIKTFQGAINPSGLITTAQGDSYIYVADVSGLSTIKVENSSLYAFYSALPDYGDSSIDNQRHSSSTYNYELNVPEGANYIALRAAAADKVAVTATGPLNVLSAKGRFTGDLNDLENNSIVNINSGSLTIESNNVPYDGFVGSVLTICGVYNQDVIRTQIAIAGENNPRFFFRSFYTTWRNWKEAADKNDISSYMPLDVLTAFSNITCCGDSLTYSQVYTGGSTSRQAYVTYPMALEKITGTPTSAIARAGYTTINWWNAFASQIEAKDNQLAIIYLGTNGGLTDTLSTDAPEGSDPSTWADTNTGCYAKMVQKFISVGAKVILVKVYASTDVQTTNKVIKDIADRFHTGIVDNNMLTDAAYHYYPDLSGSNTPHYNDLGYNAFARYLSDNIANMDKTYLKYVIPA